MRRGLKKILSLVLATSMLSSSMIIANVGAVTTVAAESSVTITESQGWLETAWVKWNMVTGADSYKVFYKKTSASSYTEIDGMLIRKYAGGVWRADVLGLPAGDYNIKVSAYKSGTELGSAESTVSVKAQDRSGFAFKGTTTPGAYNADGTLKSGAKVIYLTAEDFNTKQVTLKGKKGVEVTATGFGDILKNLAYGYEAPTAIRIIGRMTPSSYSGIAMSSEDCVEMKGLESGSNKSDYTCEVTIEGVGDDASLSGGTCFNKATYCEMRNLAVGGFGDDGVAMKTAEYMWIHNLELFYGKPGSDKDQVKGDGSIDLKDNSKYVTISYVHFWDSGKCSLCGMKSESGPNYITYHHNWFDHSDSRHPRIRTMSVHIFNNFFDSNAKYGVGAAKDSAAFVENNVFENCKHPMLSSMQGSDIAADGTGTFSGENGGIIKAYNNQISGAQSGEPVYYSATNNVEFDAYLATSREEEVPTSVKAKQGGKTFDNATLAVSNVNATPEPVETVKATVTKYAGRVNGGDFTYNWPAGAATNYDVDTALKSKVLSYVAEKAYVSVGPNENGAYVEPSTEATTSATAEETTEATTSSKEDPVEPTTATPPVIDPSGAASMGTYEFGSSATGGTFNVTDNGTYGNITFNFRSVETTGAKLRASNASTFKLAAETEVYIEYVSGAPVVITDGTTTYTFDDTTTRHTIPAGSYTLKGSTDGNSVINSMTLRSKGTATTTEATTEATTKATTEATTKAATEATTKATEATTEATTETPVDPTPSGLTALNAGTYDEATIMSDTARFELVNATTTNNQLKIKQEDKGAVKFKVNEGAVVTVTYQTGSTNAAKTARLVLNGEYGPEVTGSKTKEQVALTTKKSLAAGDYAITVEETDGNYTDCTIEILSIKVEYAAAPAVKSGDANKDGNVDSADVQHILQFVVKKIAAVKDAVAADVTKDNIVDIRDAYKISRFVKGLIPTL